MATSKQSGNTFENIIIGESAEIRNLIDTVRKIVKSTTITILVIGESGTGKELVARLIYNLGTLANQPFVDINCGAIPETLLESELFGYEKGAFTGAQNRKQGLFELAKGGTIFLDEIGNTSLNFQSKLLKAVEYKRFRRIGGVEEVNISTRIIAATNVDLLEASRIGKFREDLYYRLNVCQVVVPPLRDRGDDVIILARHFVDRFNKEYNREIKGLTADAERLIREYRWPGNVRQLKNAIERAVLIESTEWIEADDLPIHRDRNKQKTPAQTQNSSELVITDDAQDFIIPDEGISLEEVEKNLLRSALRKANGNLSETARLLKINRGKLRYRLEKFGLTSQDAQPALMV